MKVSVIIPTFNRAEMVCRAVDSVLSQTLKPDEIIVIDDGSTDQTADRLLAFGSDITVRRQENRGVSAARNRGIRQARFEWLAFLDSDDLWKPEKLERQIQALSKQTEYKICYTDEEWRKYGLWKNQKHKHLKHSGWIYRHCLPLCIISPSSVILHRTVLEDIGGYDESLPACEDYDLWLRVTSRYPVLFLPERLIVKQAGDWSQLSTRPGLDKFRIIALDNMLRSGHIEQQNRNRTQQMLAKKCAIYALGCRKHRKPKEAAWAEQIARIWSD